MTRMVFVVTFKITKTSKIGISGPIYDGMSDNLMGLGSMGTNNYDYMNPYSGGTPSLSSGTSSINNGNTRSSVSASYGKRSGQFLLVLGKFEILGYSSPRMSSSGGCSTCGMNGMNSMGGMGTMNGMTPMSPLMAMPWGKKS